MALKDEFTENGLTEEEQNVINEIESEEEDVATDSDETSKVTNDGDDVGDSKKDTEDTEDTEDAEDAEDAEYNTITSSNEPFVPKFDGGEEVANDLEKQLSSIESSIIELKTKYEEGDIDVDDFLDERDVLFSQRSEVTTQKAIYENNIRNNADIDAQLWEHDQRVFFENKDNKIFTDNPVLYGALDSSIKLLANDPSNADKTGNWILNEARRQVLDVFKDNNESSTDKSGKEEKKPIIKGAKKDIPKTLANIPASDQNESARDEFSYIDDMIQKGDVNGMERALASMTAQQQSRYLEQTGG